MNGLILKVNNFKHDGDDDDDCDGEYVFIREKLWE